MPCKSGVRLLDDGASLSGPRAAAVQVNLFDGGAFAQVGGAGCGDGQQNVLADLRMPLRRLVLQRLDSGCQFGHEMVELGRYGHKVVGSIPAKIIQPCRVPQHPRTNQKHLSSFPL